MPQSELTAAVRSAVGTSLPELLRPDGGARQCHPGRVLAVAIPGKRCDPGDLQGGHRVQTDHGLVVTDPRQQRDIVTGGGRGCDAYSTSRGPTCRPAGWGLKLDGSLA